MDTPLDITQLLKDWGNGNKEAMDELIPLVYNELRKLASSYLRSEQPDLTIQTTELVHEAYLRLVDQRSVDWQNRSHFFGIAAMQMRRILVNRARDNNAGKRGGKRIKVALDESVTGKDENLVDLIALDSALELLEAKDERKCRMVELLFFSGMTLEEASNVLGISLNTAKRDWSMARAWLYREINRRQDDEY